MGKRNSKDAQVIYFIRIQNNIYIPYGIGCSIIKRNTNPFSILQNTSYAFEDRNLTDTK